MVYAVRSAIGTRCSGKGLYSQKEGRANEVACSPVRFQRISFCAITLYSVLESEVSFTVPPFSKVFFHGTLREKTWRFDRFF
jgi:hypothetical protein